MWHVISFSFYSSLLGAGVGPSFMVGACSLAKVTRAPVSSSFLSYSSGLLSFDGKSMTTGFEAALEDELAMERRGGMVEC